MLGAHSMEALTPHSHGLKGREAPSGAELVDTRGRVLPLRETRLVGEAGQGFARMVVVQTFENVHDETLAVVYRMPLPPEGAVSGYAFEIDGRKVRGTVKPRSEAREAYEAAIASGKTAGLLDSERSNLFTQRLGNLPPKARIVATITIDMPLAWLPEGAWELRFPTVIGPRYVSTVADAADVGVAVSKHAMPLRAHLELSIGDTLVGTAESPSHSVTQKADGATTRIHFASEPGERLDRDVVVRWPVASLEVGLSLATARPAAHLPHARHAYGLVTLVPPRPSARAVPLARDLVVLVDTSGSMGGFPLEIAKIAVALLIGSLGENDRFELVEFNDSARAFRSKPVSASEKEKRAALAWVEALVAGGSTEMHAAVLGAMRSLRPSAQRQVVLVSDGYIGGEEEIVRTLVETMPDSCRLHFLGIGSAVNRSLALAMARAGRGVECVVSTGDNPERALARLLRATTAPILTNLVLSGDALVEHAPKLLPDVFAESPLRIAVKVSPEGGCLVLHGETATGPWSGRIDLPATAAGDGDPGIVALFARECVADLETRRSFDAKERDLDRAIEGLGVTFQIATLRTSWVAVDEVVSVDPKSKKRQEDVPQEVPHGTRIEGFGLRAGAHGVDNEETDVADASFVTHAYSDDLLSSVEAPTLSGSESGQFAPGRPPYLASPAMATGSRATAKRRSPLVWVAVVLLILLLLVAAIAFFVARGS